MPNRLLKEGICTSDAINMLSSDSEVLFYRLLVVADDYGRMDGRPQIIKSQCFPLKDSFTVEKILFLLEELRQANLIAFYKYDNKLFFYIKKWEQRIRSKEKYPEPTEYIDSNPLTDVSNPPSCDGLGLGLGLGKGMGMGREGVLTHTVDNSIQSREPTPAASVCLELKKIGIIDLNPSHPKLVMLIEAGASIDEFMHAARTAKDKGKGFKYVLGIVEGQRSEALQAKGKVLQGKIPNKADALLERNNDSTRNWKPPELRAQNDRT